MIKKKKKRHSLEEIDKDVVQSKSKTPLCITLFLNSFFVCFVLFFVVVVVVPINLHRCLPRH